MLEAFLWGAFAASSLVIGGAVALRVRIALASGLASLAGFAFLDGAPPGATAFVLAFAGGAILTMLADTMMPEAFANGGKLAGVVTSVGFAVAFVISTLE